MGSNPLSYLAHDPHENAAAGTTGLECEMEAFMPHHGVSQPTGRVHGCEKADLAQEGRNAESPRTPTRRIAGLGTSKL